MLIGALAIVETEDVGQVVLRVLGRADPAVILSGLQDDRVPRVLPTFGLCTVAVPLRPVERLVVVPETGNVNVAVRESGDREEEEGAQGACEESGGLWHDGVRRGELGLRVWCG